MNTRLTNTILIVMLLLNLAFVGSWWMMHNKASRSKMRHEGGLHNMQDKGMMFLTKQLDFDNTQQEQAEKIFKDHADKMKKYQSEISRLQKEIFACMANDMPDSVHAFMYSDSVGTYRVAVQKELFRSSVAIRQICNPEQKKKYDELMQNMGKRLGHQMDMHGGSMRHDSL
jgi:Spy/CpxP family protein refolding chaperone